MDVSGDVEVLEAFRYHVAFISAPPIHVGYNEAVQELLHAFYQRQSYSGLPPLGWTLEQWQGRLANDLGVMVNHARGMSSVSLTTLLVC